MKNEVKRIADQLRRAFGGDAWHGPPLSELLAGVTAEMANMRPLASAHTIWELVLHIEVYASAAVGVADGGTMPKIYGSKEDWRTVEDRSEAAWVAAVEGLLKVGERLAGAIEDFEDERLAGIVPGRDYDFYYLFHGIVQHSLFHGGQIAMLKRAALGAAN